MSLIPIDAEYHFVQDTAPTTANAGDVWLDTSQNPPVAKIYADVGSGGSWLQTESDSTISENLDAPVSEAGASTEVINHDLRFVKQMAKLEFDRGIDQLSYNNGLFDIFADNKKITTTELGSYETSYDMSQTVGDAIAIANDGSNFYVFDDYNSRDTIHEYDLNGNYTSNSYDISAQVGAGRDITWSGSYFYVVDNNSDKVYQFNSDWSYNNFSFDVGANDTNAQGLTYLNGNLYYVGGNSSKIYVYETDGTYTGNSYNTPSTATNLQSITNDGSKLYVVGYDDRWVFILSDTGEWLGDYDISNQEYNPSGVSCLDGYSYIVGDDTKIYKHSATPSPIANFGVNGNLKNVVQFDADYPDKEGQFDYYDSSGEIGNYLEGGTMNDDGTKLYVLAYQYIYVYDLENPFDISNPTYTGTQVDISNKTRLDDYKNIQFSEDGTKIFTFGMDNSYSEAEVIEYELDSAWEITGSWNELEHKREYYAFYGGKISPNGKHVTAIAQDNSGGTELVQHNLSTPWDLSSEESKEVINDIGNSEDMSLAWSDDGKRLFLNDGSLAEYHLDTPFDVSTIVVDSNNNPVSFGSSNINGQRATLVNENEQEMITIKRTSYQWYKYPIGEERTEPKFTESKTLSYTPSSLIVSHETEKDCEVDYEISDSNGNVVIVNDSDIGTEISVNSLTNGDIKVTGTLKPTSVSSNNKLNNFGIYFK